MPRHHDNDACFETPDDWQDRTVVAHAATKETANFVMTRDPMRPGDTLRAHVNRLLLQLGKNMKDFELLESRETTVGGLPAVCMSFTWTSATGGLEQTLTVLERAIDQSRVAVSFATTSPIETAPRTRLVFEAILKSVRFANGPTLAALPPLPASVYPSAPASAYPSTLVPPSSQTVPTAAFHDLVTPSFPMPGSRSSGRQ